LARYFVAKAPDARISPMSTILVKLLLSSIMIGRFGIGSV
jgi:hypothetical protein